MQQVIISSLIKNVEEVSMHKESMIMNPHPEICAQQSTKEECDINVIMERAKRGAVVSHIHDRTPVYGDFTEIPTDLRVALTLVKDAERAFMSLDAFVRERFHNEPAEMIDFLNDPKNREEGIKLGLVAPKAVATEVPPVEPEKEASK
jgi:phage internal scaffolding protein